MELLPTEMLLKILTFTHVPDALPVCLHWNELIQDNRTKMNRTRVNVLRFIDDSGTLCIDILKTHKDKKWKRLDYQGEDFFERIWFLAPETIEFAAQKPQTWKSIMTAIPSWWYSSIIEVTSARDTNSNLIPFLKKATNIHSMELHSRGPPVCHILKALTSVKRFHLFPCKAKVRTTDVDLFIAKSHASDGLEILSLPHSSTIELEWAIKLIQKAKIARNCYLIFMNVIGREEDFENFLRSTSTKYYDDFNKTSGSGETCYRIRRPNLDLCVQISKFVDIQEDGII